MVFIQTVVIWEIRLIDDLKIFLGFSGFLEKFSGKRHGIENTDRIKTDFCNEITGIMQDEE